MCAVKEFSKDHPTSTASKIAEGVPGVAGVQEFQNGESDGVSGSGGDGEAFGNPLQSSFVVLDFFCTRLGCGIDWRSTSCREKRKKRDRIANVAQKVEDDFLRRSKLARSAWDPPETPSGFLRLRITSAPAANFINMLEQVSGIFVNPRRTGPFQLLLPIAAR
jgi:hypothetical protein